MSTSRPLRGSCSCGRNNYIVNIPENAAHIAHIYFDSSSESRRSQAAPLLAWLHIPLAWFQSSTTSFFPDETHATIRRTFTPPNEPHCKKIFCGFCGTHLTRWSESPVDEATYLNVTVGSLFGEDLRALDELRLLANEIDNLDTVDAASLLPSTEGDQKTRVVGYGDPSPKTLRKTFVGDLTWMEEALDGSKLGRSQRIKTGVSKSADGTERVEWEIVEMLEEGSDPEFLAGRAKRKIGEAALGSDSQEPQYGDIDMKIQ